MNLVNRTLKEWIERLEDGNYSEMPLFIDDLWDLKSETEFYVGELYKGIEKLRVALKELQKEDDPL